MIRISVIWHSKSCDVGMKKGYQLDAIVNDCWEIELNQEFHRELLKCKIAKKMLRLF